MRNPNEIPAYCGECRFFNRNCCYFGKRNKVNKFMEVCYDIKYLQGGWTNEELWNDECRTLRAQGRYNSKEYLYNRPYEI